MECAKWYCAKMLPMLWNQTWRKENCICWDHALAALKLLVLSD